MPKLVTVPENYTHVPYECVYNPNCNSTDSEGTCIHCIESYTVAGIYDDRVCVYNPNCATFGKKGICDSCKNGYIFTKDKTCVQDSHCVSANRTFYCTKCEDGYSLSVNNLTCVYNPKCTSLDSLGMCKESGLSKLKNEVKLFLASARFERKSEKNAAFILSTPNHAKILFNQFNSTFNPLTSSCITFQFTHYCLIHFSLIQSLLFHYHQIVQC